MATDRYWFKCPTCEHGLWMFRNVDYEERIVQCGKCGKFCEFNGGKWIPYKFEPISGLSQFGRAMQEAERTSKTRPMYSPLPEERPVTEVRVELPPESLTRIQNQLANIRNELLKKKVAKHDKV